MYQNHSRDRKTAFRRMRYFSLLLSCMGAISSRAPCFWQEKRLHPKNKDNEEAVICQNVEEGCSTGEPLCFNINS